jgi:cytoskeleton protein RodZ
MKMTQKKTAAVKESKTRLQTNAVEKPLLKAVQVDVEETLSSPIPPVKVKSIGEILRVVRESRGDSLKEVGAYLRISERYLVAIEAMSLADLPEQVYALGFVRSYAQYLGVDPQKSVTQFKAEIYASATVTKQMSVLRPIDVSGFPTKNILWISAIVLCLATAVGYIFFGKTQPVALDQDVSALLKPLAPMTEEAPDETAVDGSAEEEGPNDTPAETLIPTPKTTPMVEAPNFVLPPLTIDKKQTSQTTVTEPE